MAIKFNEMGVAFGSAREVLKAMRHGDAIQGVDNQGRHYEKQARRDALGGTLVGLYTIARDDLKTFKA